eukprot:gene14806-285_t
MSRPFSIADLDGLFAAAGADDDLDSVEQAQRLAALMYKQYVNDPMDDELDNGGGSIGTGASQLSSSSDGAGPAVEPSAAEAAAATKKKEETVQLQDTFRRATLSTPGGKSRAAAAELERSPVGAMESTLDLLNRRMDEQLKAIEFKTDRSAQRAEAHAEMLQKEQERARTVLRRAAGKSLILQKLDAGKGGVGGGGSGDDGVSDPKTPDGKQEKQSDFQALGLSAEDEKLLLTPVMLDDRAREPAAPTDGGGTLIQELGLAGRLAAEEGGGGKTADNGGGEGDPPVMARLQSGKTRNNRGGGTAGQGPIDAGLGLRRARANTAQSSPHPRLAGSIRPRAATGSSSMRRNRKLPSAPMLSSLANGNGALILPLRTREARKSLDGMDASSSVVDDAANGGRSGLPAEVRRGSADNEFDGIMGALLGGAIPNAVEGSGNGAGAAVGNNGSDGVDTAEVARSLMSWDEPDDHIQQALTTIPGSPNNSPSRGVAHDTSRGVSPQSSPGRRVANPPLPAGLLASAVDATAPVSPGKAKRRWRPSFKKKKKKDKGAPPPVAQEISLPFSFNHLSHMEPEEAVRIM